MALRKEAAAKKIGVRRGKKQLSLRIRHLPSLVKLAPTPATTKHHIVCSQRQTAAKDWESSCKRSRFQL